jgi:hypothetical protein
MWCVAGLKRRDIRRRFQLFSQVSGTDKSSLNNTPSSNGLILSMPRILRHDFYATSISLNASQRNVDHDSQFLARVVQCRTMANL